MANNQDKVAADVAEAEFYRFTEAMDIETDPKAIGEDVDGFNRVKGRIVKAICRGDLVVNENGEAVYTPSHREAKYREAITFHEQTGASLMALDGATKKNAQPVRQTFAVMADMCRVEPKVFANMVGTDLKVCMALFQLLSD